MSDRRATRAEALPFSTEGVVDVPVDEGDALAVDPRALAERFDGYELVDHARVALSPVSIREAPDGDGDGGPRPPGEGRA